MSAQLIDTTTGVHVWAGTYDRELRDVFAAQDEISQAIGSAAGQELIQIGTRRAMRKQPQDLDALDHFLRGQWHSRQEEREHNAEARSHFERAIEIDPYFAPAYAGLTGTHNNNIVQRWTETPEHSAAEAFRVAQACTAVEPTSFYCHMAQAMAHQLVGGYETVIAHLERAIRINPSSALAYSVLGWALASAGRPDEAIPELDKALRLSPRDPQLWLFQFFMGWGHFSAGRYEDSVSWMRKSLHYSDQVITHRVLASSYAHLGRMEEARAALADVLRLQPDLTISAIRLELTFMDPSLLERYFDGLRKVGLPE